MGHTWDSGRLHYVLGLRFSLHVFGALEKGRRNIPGTEGRRNIPGTEGRRNIPGTEGRRNIPGTKGEGQGFSVTRVQIN